MVALLLAWLLTVPAGAEPIPEELTDALPAEAEQRMDELPDDAYDHSTLLRGLEQIWQYIATHFFSAFRENIGAGVLLLGVVLLCSVTNELYETSSGGHPGGFVNMAGTLVIALIAVGSVRSLIGAGMETIEELDIFAKALLPTLAAAVAASGGFVSASVHQVSTVLFTNLLISLIRQILLPLVYFYVAVAVADSVLPQHDLERIRNGIGKVVTWALTGMLLLFTGYLSLSGAAGTTADSLTLRLTRSAIGTAVPVVGGIISDATESVLASAGLLKSAIGVFGTLGVLMICLTPFLRLAVQYITYKLTAFLAATVGGEPLVKLIDAVGTAFGLVLGMTGACALLLLISMASAVSVTVR